VEERNGQDRGRSPRAVLKLGGDGRTQILYILGHYGAIDEVWESLLYIYSLLLLSRGISQRMFSTLLSFSLCFCVGISRKSRGSDANQVTSKHGYYYYYYYYHYSLVKVALPSSALFFFLLTTRASKYCYIDRSSVTVDRE